MPTLAELRAQTGPKPLPKASATVTMVEGQHLLTRMLELTQEAEDLELRAERDREDGKEDGRARTRKAGERPKPDPRIAEIEAEAQAIMAGGLAEFQASVGLTGLTGGEWQQYKNDHPPRKDHEDDVRLADGCCNASDLFSDLGRFVVSWEGDDVASGDWDGWLAERICYADRRDLVREVVRMHERKLNRVPKSPTSSSPTESSATA